MYFQIIDTDHKCKKSYTDSGIVDYADSNKEFRTWKHTSHLANRPDVEYAFLYVNGDLNLACPTYIKDHWERSFGRMSAIMKTVYHAECDMENSCIYDYIPDWILNDFLSTKQEIIKHVFENIEKPSHYEALKRSHILCEEINSQPKFYNGALKKTNYSIFGTKTGRLSNAKSEIPILTMKKEDRSLLRPRNDLFVEFDFNAAELRTLLALSEQQQPEEDIHDWTAKKLNSCRDEIKKRTFAWLYNPEASDSLLETLYDRKSIKGRFYENSTANTPFLRKIEVDDRRALNYIVQSTSSDVCIEQAYKLRNFFNGKRTNLCYLLHDSVILDFAKEDRDCFLEAKEIFSKTRLGNYRVNASIGKDFGNMRSL